MQIFLSRHSKLIAWSLTAVIYLELVLSSVAVRAAALPYHKEVARLNLPLTLVSDNEKIALNNGKPQPQNFSISQLTISPDSVSGGPGQPEMEAFSSVNNSNMVDLFSGDFSYNIPLLDVGGYPVNLSYRAGVSMDQDASWVGLGWNVNPGTVSRNLRGLPDDFNGKNDSITKVQSIKENKTVGITTGADIEIVGSPIGVGASYGIFHNNYRGWGLETAINVSLNSGSKSNGSLTGGLSIANNSQEGLTISPSLSLSLKQKEDQEVDLTTSVSGSFSYNSRAGIKGLNLSAGVRQAKTFYGNQGQYTRGVGESFSSFISFASPTYTPGITMPLTSNQFSFTAKVGVEYKVIHPSFFLGGYISRQKIEDEDTLFSLPAYGYLHLKEGGENAAGLMDFNREKEIPYREKPAIPHIAVPGYTYDAFSITGEGTGGMFRAYRGDVGVIHDHFIRTKDNSDRASVDLGVTDLVHAGIDLNINRAFTQSGPWVEKNLAKSSLNFTNDSVLYESVYFRNPGEKSINTKQYYDSLGGDDVVAVQLFQAGRNSPSILATNSMTRFKAKLPIGNLPLDISKTRKSQRDKRTQVISYLTAAEASVAGLSKYVENYTPNVFNSAFCNNDPLDDLEGTGTGLIADYFPTRFLTGTPYRRIDSRIDSIYGGGKPSIPGYLPAGFPTNQFSVRWTGRIKAPVTGTYIFTTFNVDDGVKLWLNDSLLIDDWKDHKDATKHDTVYLMGGEFYKIKMEYYENKGDAAVSLRWRHPNQATSIPIPTANLFLPAIDSFVVSNIVKEKRVNAFRKDNHISEINVLNTDGRRYVYGLPVYNLKQKDVTFSVKKENATLSAGLVDYDSTQDNSPRNPNGRDNYYTREEIPAYAHSFLLTGILSSDYVDISNNGISDDDLGDAVKFNYSKICGIKNPYGWKTPRGHNKASYNEGLKSDNRDDKGSYVYGEKELWYLHSIESKTMIATFIVENRKDLTGTTENGQSMGIGMTKRLAKIHLYSKSDFLKDPTKAKPIKTVHFEYGYDLCMGANLPADSGKLTLKKVWFSYNGNTKGMLNPYVFNYANNQPYNTKSYDRWGNFKNPLDNPGSVVGNVKENDEYPYALQDSAKAAVNAAAWNLDSISLPSGGKMKITYESDEYAFVQNRRSMQLFNILGLDTLPGKASNFSNQLYYKSNTPGYIKDNRYIYISIPNGIASARLFREQYLQKIKKIHFKMFVKMPGDQFGSGHEYINCYADIDDENAFGLSSSTIAWVKIKGISLKGDGAGEYSPLAKAAIQFLRMNLQSKAYPNSEVGDNLTGEAAVRLVSSLGSNLVNGLKSYDEVARKNGWATEIMLNRSYIRLNDPDYRKFGGGHRVKKIVIYDNWNKMTGQREATYGQEYVYTTKKNLGDTTMIISSGVASYEPGIGGEENPFHLPIEFIDKAAPAAPVTLGYTEEPLGETFFPSAGVGYSQVRVKTIHAGSKKSANGLTETKFFTAYDYPTYVDMSIIDDDSKKRFKPTLANFLRINARHHLFLSQGFKIELNDMHGKIRSQASYPQTDPDHYITYTENFYKTDDVTADNPRLTNTVSVLMPDGTVDTSALIGKDVELMVDMREQLSVTNGYNVNLNTEIFTIPFPTPPFFLIPSLLNLAQREENIFRSAATMKVIQRYGILDSVIHIDKGSIISTKNLVYDSETGDVVLTRTHNEFNDSVYNFSYPSHWAYDGMGLAYKNINAVVKKATIRSGRLVSGLANPETVFSSGDEIFVAGKQNAAPGAGCTVIPSTFPAFTKIWAIDSSVLNGGISSIYFIDADGKPYTGFDVSLTVIRSGRRNALSSVGEITSMNSPLVKDPGTNLYSLVVNANSKIVTASAAEFKQFWKVAEVKKNAKVTTCIPQNSDSLADAYDVSSCNNCLLPFFNYLISVRQLFITQSQNITIGQLIVDANNAGFSNVSATNCPILGTNANKLFYALTVDSISDIYRAKLGDCIIAFKAQGGWAVSPGNSDAELSLNGLASNLSSGPYTSEELFGQNLMASYPVNFNQMTNGNCDGSGRAHYNYLVPGTGGGSGNCYGYTFYGFISTPGEVVGYNVTYQSCITGNDTTITGTYGTPGSNFTGQVGPIEIDVCSRQGSIHILSGLDTIGRFTCGSYSGIPTQNFNVVLSVDSCSTCTPIYSSLCYNPITDTATNPYVYGMLGNFRSNLAYTYYGDRAETQFADTTNIRRYGTYQEFAPFWTFQSGKLKPNYDESKWVWNSEMTLFNKKGLEVENRDPLGRYNSGLYGYYQTLPVAVIQNARYRESAVEGFEDYTFNTQVCDTACPTTRHFDFSNFKSKMDTLVKHSGKRSVKLTGTETISVSSTLTLKIADTLRPSIQFNTISDACVSGQNVLKQVKASPNNLLPNFSPTPGEKMILSAWVQEDTSCKCTNFVKNEINISFAGSLTTYAFKSKGSIIEGWQRYESVFEIPSSATAMTVTLRSLSASKVHFDDLRIHPYNSNMKSFVFHPINLRLMAELDENNYSTFYEYDDDGTLIRVKKETQRGIKTIKETRSALLKQ